MRPGGGRAKGNLFERIVAREIRNAFGFDKADCYRTPSSGGHRFARKSDPGDLVMSPRLKKIFPFLVEAKHYKDISLKAFFQPEEERNALIKGWIEQCKAEVRVMEYPLLVFKTDQGEMFCATSAPVNYNKHGFSCAAFSVNGGRWYLARFSDFLYSWKASLE